MSSLIATRGAGTPALTLSDMVIPSVPGEFYVYPAHFTQKRPLYALMKCKANKDRPIGLAKELGHEANFLFLFNSLGYAEILSTKTADRESLLGGMVDEKSFDDNWIAQAHATEEDFHSVCSEKNTERLVEICQKSLLSKSSTRLVLYPGRIAAIMTAGGKFGLFIVEEINSSSVKINACHVLV